MPEWRVAMEVMIAVQRGTLLRALRVLLKILNREKRS